MFEAWEMGFEGGKLANLPAKTWTEVQLTRALGPH
jgi:hypothetical protein